MATSPPSLERISSLQNKSSKERQNCYAKWVEEINPKRKTAVRTRKGRIVERGKVWRENATSTNKHGMVATYPIFWSTRRLLWNSLQGDRIHQLSGLKKEKISLLLRTLVEYQRWNQHPQKSLKKPLYLLINILQISWLWEKKWEHARQNLNIFHITQPTNCPVVNEEFLFPAQEKIHEKPFLGKTQFPSYKNSFCSEKQAHHCTTN